MWEHRCKVAVSGVGFSKVTRSAEIPLAAHALEAVKGAVADSGLAMSDIDGLATYPELPATGHADGGRHHHRLRELHDGDAEAPEPHLARPGGDGQHRRRGPAGGQRVARRRVQVRGGVAGDAQPARAPIRTCRARMPPARRSSRRRTASAAPVRAWRSRTRAGSSGTTRAARRWPRSPSPSAGTRSMNPHAYFYGTAAHARGLPEFADGRVSVLSLRLRYPRAGRGRHRAHDRRPRARS